MKISKQEVFLMLTILDNTYRTKFTSDDNSAKLTTEIWYESLEPYPKDLVLSIFKDTIKKSRYAPVPADLVDKLDLVCNNSQKNQEQLWYELEQAVYDTSQILYYAEHPIYDATGKVKQRSMREQLLDLYNGLNPVLKEFVPSVGALVSFANLDNLEFEKNRFIKRVPELREIVNTKKKYGISECLDFNRNKTKLIGENENDYNKQSNYNSQSRIGA